MWAVMSGGQRVVMALISGLGAGCGRESGKYLPCICWRGRGWEARVLSRVTPPLFCPAVRTAANAVNRPFHGLARWGLDRNSKGDHVYGKIQRYRSTCSPARWRLRLR